MAEMNILFDEERLRKLIANLNILTGLPRSEEHTTDLQSQR